MSWDEALGEMVDRWQRIRARGRAARDPRVLLQRAPGTVQPMDSDGALSRARDHAPPAGDHLRHVRRRRVGVDLRAGRRGRSGDDGPLRSDRLVERGPRHDRRPRLGQDRGGPGAGHAAGRDRPPAEPYRAPRPTGTSPPGSAPTRRWRSA